MEIFPMMELILFATALTSTMATAFFLSRHRFASLPVRAGRRGRQR